MTAQFNDMKWPTVWLELLFWVFRGKATGVNYVTEWLISMEAISRQAVLKFWITYVAHDYQHDFQIVSNFQITFNCDNVKFP